MQRIENPCVSIRHRAPPPYSLSITSLLLASIPRCPGSEIGRYEGFEIPSSQGRDDSSPAPGKISSDSFR
jgi:hypothetical protein